MDFTSVYYGGDRERIDAGSIEVRTRIWTGKESPSWQWHTQLTDAGRRTRQRTDVGRSGSIRYLLSQTNRNRAAAVVIKRSRKRSTYAGREIGPAPDVNKADRVSKKRSEFHSSVRFDRHVPWTHAGCLVQVLSDGGKKSFRSIRQTTGVDEPSGKRCRPNA